jgi:hypothetical protein
MHRFMTTGRPAGAAGKAGRVILPADKNLSRDLLLEMAFQAEGRIALREHALIHGTMWLVTDEATFARRFVFVNVGPALDSVTLKTGLILSHERSAAGDDRVALMGIMTISAVHFAFEDGMMVRQIELAPLVQMAVEAGFRGFPRIDYRGTRSPRLVMDAARAMARFTAHVEGVGAGRSEFGVRRSGEVTRNILVALSAALRADELGAWDCGRRDDGAGNGRAGDKNYSDEERDDQGGEPPVAAKS